MGNLSKMGDEIIQRCVSPAGRGEHLHFAAISAALRHHNQRHPRSFRNGSLWWKVWQFRSIHTHLISRSIITHPPRLFSRVSPLESYLGLLQGVRNNLHEIWQQMLIAVREIAALTGLMICGECTEAQTVKGNEMSDGSAKRIILLPTLSLSNSPFCIIGPHRNTSRLTAQNSPAVFVNV